MRKFFPVLAACLVLFLAGCQTKSQQASKAAKQTVATLNDQERVWLQVGMVTATTDSQGVAKATYAKTAASDAPQTTITRKDALNLGEHRTTYTKLKLTGKATSVKLLNQLLKAAKAKGRLTSLNQLTVYAEDGTNTPEGNGYIVFDKQLYCLPLTWTPGAETVVRVSSTTGLKTPAKTTLSKLAGRWQANGEDASELRVMPDHLYITKTTGTFTDYSRYKLQTLRTMNDAALYTGQYQQMVTLAARYGYALHKATTIAASDGNTLYLFLDNTHMEMISTSGVTDYTKSDVGADTTKLPTEISEIFKAADKRAMTKKVHSIAGLNNGTYEVCSNADDLLTQNFFTDQNDYQYASVAQGKVTFEDVQ